MVCPAKVSYSRVLDAARTALATPQRTRLTRLLAVVLDSPVLRALLRAGLVVCSALFDRTAPHSHQPHRLLPPHTGWRRLLAYRPVVRRQRAVRPLPGAGPARIGLFTGCVGDIAERAVLADVQRLFQAAGVTVAVPPTQGCCGALHQHGGLPAAAAARAARNAAAFAGCETVLALASGCGTALRDLHTAQNGAAAQPLGPKVRDLCTTLAAALDATPPPFAETRVRVGIHTACTQANVFGARGAIRQLLARIPGIELVELAPNSGCCGAAGSAFITQAPQAVALLQPKLDAAVGLDLIVSANIGCSLHLLAGLRSRGRPIPVLHPVTLLAQALTSHAPAAKSA